MGAKNIGIYVHIPFCKKKCEYCDFKSYTGKESLIEQYIKWVKYELQEVGEGNRKDYEEGRDDLVIVKSIYIGGGTPAIIPAKYISEILETIKKYFVLAGMDNLEKSNKENNNVRTTEDIANKTGSIEITIEVNPGTVDEEKLKEYKRCGINRLSIGLQSTQDKILKTLGRIHLYSDFLNTYNTARKIGFENINVDLMLGIPNQTIEDVEESINNIIKLSPEHISTYSLIIEEGTPFYNKLEANEITLPSDEIERKMYWLVKTKLEEAGFKEVHLGDADYNAMFTIYVHDGFDLALSINCYDDNILRITADKISRHYRYNKERLQDELLAYGNEKAVSVPSASLEGAYAYLDTSFVNNFHFLSLTVGLGNYIPSIVEELLANNWVKVEENEIYIILIDDSEEENVFRMILSYDEKNMITQIRYSF